MTKFRRHLIDSVPRKRLIKLYKKYRGVGEGVLKYVNPKKFDKFFKEKWGFIKDLKASRRPKSRVLDIGTGIGLLPWMFRMCGHDAIGADCHHTEFYADAIDILQVPFVKICINGPSKFVLDDTYDIITCTRTVFDSGWSEENYEVFFCEIKKYLNKGGLYMKTNYPSKWRKNPHIIIHE